MHRQNFEFPGTSITDLRLPSSLAHSASCAPIIATAEGRRLGFYRLRIIGENMNRVHKVYREQIERIHAPGPAP